VTDEPGSGNCSSTTGRWTLEQLLPTSESIADMQVPAKGDWQPLPDADVLPGIWMAPGGGRLLELGEDGEYIAATGSGQMVDHGQWTLNESRSRLSLISANDSRPCDGLILDQLEYLNPSTDMLRGFYGRNTCNGTWISELWFHIPDATG
jgi:hypothetical protein